jgi:hypothetical protein
MTTNKFNPTIIEEGLGAVTIAVTILASPLLRPWYSKWGASEAEVKKRMPGDDQVPDPTLESTRAITIQAPMAEVWPWLVQMGQGRGGLHSYERLENLVGCDMHNAERIIPEQQHLSVGDKVRLSQADSTPYFVVTAIEPGRAIILGGDDPPTTWGFILEPIDENSTRLIIRFRQQYEPSLGNVIGWRVFTDPITFVMERKMLQGIKVRAEAA